MPRIQLCRVTTATSTATLALVAMAGTAIAPRPA